MTHRMCITPLIQFPSFRMIQTRLSGQYSNLTRPIFTRATQCWLATLPLAILRNKYFVFLSRKWLKRSIEVLEMESLRSLTLMLQRSNPNPVLIVTLPRNEWIIPDVFTYFSQIHCHRLCHSSGRELKNKESEMSFLEESKNIFRGKVWSGTDLYTLGISAEYNHMIIWSYDQMVFLQNTIIHISIW